MQLQLGLVCISEMLRQHGVAAKTMTRAQYLKLGRDAGLQTLSQRILSNAKNLKTIIEHCAKSGISHYRLSSTIFPLITDISLGINMNDLQDIIEIKNELQIAGNVAKLYNISLSTHPDQFNVLCSYNDAVVERTIRELNHQSAIMDMIGCAQDYSASMCLHLNCKPNLKIETITQYRDRFLSNLKKCDIGVQSRLVLENEDGGYWNCKALFETFGQYLPLVYDNLHDNCNPSCNQYENIANFKSTWPSKITPIFHWSEGINGTKKHCDRASHIPEIVNANRDCKWEVELKAKDYAITEIFNYEINK